MSEDQANKLFACLKFVKNKGQDLLPHKTDTY